MAHLIYLVYSSAASHAFSRAQLTDLLIQARTKNEQLGITGMLLYTDGSFFQVLEGEAKTVETLFETIERDFRHTHITMILKESTPHRLFGDWTMAFAHMTPDEVNVILGSNDFFHQGESYVNLGEGRAKKLLAAFKEGRWRNKLSDTATPTSTAYAMIPVNCAVTATSDSPHHSFSGDAQWYSFAYQPIVNITTRTIHSYEALVRTIDNRPAIHVFEKVATSDMHTFDEKIRVRAVELAGRLGLTTHLNLNFLPLSMESSPMTISSVLEAAERSDIRPDQIIIEILEKEFISDFDHFNEQINRYRASGLSFAIDDFGSGFAGLNLLADFLPEYIKLDIHLIRSINQKGPRQAIIHGIMRTCTDLGITVIAEGVETVEEYLWLKDQGIELFQGWLFAKPAFEQLVTTVQLPLLSFGKGI